MQAEILIDAFLQNFSYLNNQGKRSGWLMFGNRALTHKLENIATKLKEDLTALKSNAKLTDMQKCEQLIELVGRSFDTAESARVDFGRTCNPRNNKPITFFEGYHQSVREYKKPYKPAKFERELNKGLMAVNAAIADLTIKQEDPDHNLNNINRKCNELIMKIDEFQQPKVALSSGTSLLKAR